MTRWLVLALLIANVGYAVWAHYRPPAPQASAESPSKPPPEGPLLQLVERDTVYTLTVRRPALALEGLEPNEAATAEAHPPEPAEPPPDTPPAPVAMPTEPSEQQPPEPPAPPQATQPDAPAEEPPPARPEPPPPPSEAPPPQPGGQPEEAEPATQPPAPSPAARQTLTCFTVGPEHDLEAAPKLMDSLAELGLEPVLRSGHTEHINAYWVHIGPFESWEATVAEMERLAALGIEDYALIPRSVRDNSISLGLYRARRFAERRVARIRALGYKPTIEARTRRQEAYWIDFGVTGPSDLAQWQERFPDRNIDTRPCPAELSPPREPPPQPRPR